MRASRKDFKKIAEVVNNILHEYSDENGCPDIIKEIMTALVDDLEPIFKRSNPRYNHDTFIAACWKGIEK